MNDAPSLPAIAGPSDILQAIVKIAADPSVDPGRIGALIELHRSLQADQAKQEFNQAFAALTAVLPRITKKGEVKYPKDKGNPTGPLIKAFSYARWEDIDEIIRPLMDEHGFWFDFNTEPMPDGRVIVHGTLHHRGGHSRSSQIGPLPLDTSGGKNNIQALGSTFSYGKRYCGTMLLNLIFEGEDDDGVAGGTILIDAASVKKLSDLIMATNSRLDGFLKFMNVESLADIQLVDFPRAINGLLAKMTPEQFVEWQKREDAEKKK